MKTKIWMGLCTLVLIFSSVTNAGVSSIKEQNQSPKEIVSANSERDLLEKYIRTYVSKQGANKLEGVYAKLTQATIDSFPKKYQTYLVMIKEILEDSYRIGQKIPTAQEIRSKGTLQQESQSLKLLALREKTEQSKIISQSEELLVEVEDHTLEREKKVLLVRNGESEKSETDQSNIDEILQQPVEKKLPIFQVQGPIDVDPIVVQTLPHQDKGSIDEGILQQTWLGRVNAIRKERGRKTISLSTELHETATERSELLKAKGVADHRRTSSSSYYNYTEIENRFEQRGISFVNVNRATFTENIGYARLTCSVGDCTQSAIKAMRTVFDFFISEEGKANDAHWRTIMHPNFKIMGMGIAVDESSKRLYVTQHYGTAIE